MAQPTPYDRYTNFGEEQALAPTAPLRGLAVDAELDRLKQTTDEMLNNLALIQRDDGQLANGTVGADQLKPSLSIGFTLRGEWTAATNYLLGDGVTYSNAFYRALASHLSVLGQTPDIAVANWQLLVDFNDFAPAIIADGSVTTPKLADEAVTNAKLADEAVTNAKLAGNAVDTAEIVDNAVTEPKLADSAVTNAKLADNAVNTAEIVDNSVTNAKLANMAVNTIKGRVTAGTGDPEDLTAAHILAILQSTLDSRYAMQLISEAPMTGASGAYFTSIPTGFRQLYALGTGLVFSGTGVNLLMNISSTAGASWETGSTGQYTQFLWSGGASFATSTNTTIAGMLAVSNAKTVYKSAFELRLFDPDDATARHQVHISSLGSISNGDLHLYRTIMGETIPTVGGAINALRFVTSGGTVSGKIALYGIK